MGGKKGIPSAKDKAAVKEKERLAQAAKAKEDNEWEQAGEGKKTKAQARRSAKDDDRQESLAKKQEARKMAEEEAAALAKAVKKPVPKVTRYELEKQADRDKQAVATRASGNAREVDEEAYRQLVDAQHENTLDSLTEARNVDQALSLLNLEEKPKLKFSEYLERELPQLKKDKPGLKAPQYKDIIWKKWLRSPENPLNQKKT